MPDEIAVRRVTGTGVPIRGDDVDTDQILPARFLKAVTFDDVADHLFHDARRENGERTGDHPLDRFPDARIAVVGANFGCGSSREHAPQAMRRWGIEAVVGVSFADIFRDNCTSIGLPALSAPAEAVERLQSWIEANPDGEVAVDVANTTVTYADRSVQATMDEAAREAFVTGTWDTTAVMAANADRTRAVADALPYVGPTDPTTIEKP